MLSLSNQETLPDTVIYNLAFQNKLCVVFLRPRWLLSFYSLSFPTASLSCWSRTGLSPTRFGHCYFTFAIKIDTQCKTLHMQKAETEAKHSIFVASPDFFNAHSNLFFLPDIQVKTRISNIADAILNRCLPASHIYFKTTHCFFPTLESIECHKASPSSLTSPHWLLNTLAKWSVLQQTFRRRYGTSATQGYA